jgi:hypothetical protein
MGSVLKIVGGVLGAIAGAAIVVISGGSALLALPAMAAGASIGASTKPLVKLENMGVGAGEGFIISGFNPIGALMGAAFVGPTGGKLAGPTNLIAGAAGGVVTGLLATSATSGPYSTYASTQIGQAAGNPLFANPIAAAYGTSPISTSITAYQTASGAGNIATDLSTPQQTLTMPSVTTTGFSSANILPPLQQSTVGSVSAPNTYHYGGI